MHAAQANIPLLSAPLTPAVHKHDVVRSQTIKLANALIVANPAIDIEVNGIEAEDKATPAKALGCIVLGLPSKVTLRSEMHPEKA